MRLGLREATRHLSKVVKALKAGNEVILIERGKPIAVITPLRQASASDSVIRRLEGAGLLRPARLSKPLPAWTPRPMKGVPLARTLRAERSAS